MAAIEYRLNGLLVCRIGYIMYDHYFIFFTKISWILLTQINFHTNMYHSTSRNNDANIYIIIIINYLPTFCTIHFASRILYLFYFTIKINYY